MALLFPGLGFCMVYMPAVLTVGFYFERWRALATGLALCGSGVGTFVFAPITVKLIDNLGWRLTVLVHGGNSFKLRRPLHNEYLLTSWVI